jgi:hypothetical protein
MQAENKQAEMKKAIKETIAFFDLFDFPLTEYELWIYLSLKCEFGELLNYINEAEINYCSGFYYLPGREEIVKTRLRRYNYADQKFKKIMKIIKLFGFMPWIKLAAVGNIMGAHNLKEESDIDLFIITEKNRVWTCRFFCVLLCEALRLRPKKNNFKNKICLSFFVDEENQDLDKFHLKNIDLDIYFIYWLAGLSPIYEKNGSYKELIDKNKSLEKYLPNWRPVDSSFLRKIQIEKKRSLGASGYFFDYIENIIRRISIFLMNKDLKTAANKKEGVEIGSGVLKLHLKDRRLQIYESWKQKV